jgi:hypothetical protein
MAVENYAGATLGKLGFTALGKICAVSAATVILTLTTAALAVAAGALIIKEIADFEILNEKKPKTD